MTIGCMCWELRSESRISSFLSERVIDCSSLRLFLLLLLLSPSPLLLPENMKLCLRSSKLSSGESETGFSHEGSFAELESAENTNGYIRVKIPHVPDNIVALMLIHCRLIAHACDCYKDKWVQYYCLLWSYINSFNRDCPIIESKLGI